MHRTSESPCTQSHWGSLNHIHPGSTILKSSKDCVYNKFICCNSVWSRWSVPYQLYCAEFHNLPHCACVSPCYYSMSYSCEIPVLQIAHCTLTTQLAAIKAHFSAGFSTEQSRGLYWSPTCSHLLNLLAQATSNWRCVSETTHWLLEVKGTRKLLVLECSLSGWQL